MRLAHVSFIAGVLLTGGLVTSTGNGHAQASCAARGLAETDRTLIEEAYHLQAELGPRVWPGWTQRAVPLLYKTAVCDFLINHSDPPPGFTRADDTLSGRQYWYRANGDTATYRAAYPINGIVSAVLTSPEDRVLVHAWTLEAVHEFFHVYQHEQRSARIVDPFIGVHSGHNELSYPFPYDSEPVRSLMRVEAEQVFGPIKDVEVDDSDVRMAVRVLGHVQRVAAAVFEDSLDLRYKRWLEWYEGVARYTEREMSSLAASSRYTPTRGFAARYGTGGYRDAWSRNYSNSLSPIRFVGEGVQGRVQFYYLGMGKAYLLDRFRPDWRHSYFDRHLDDLLLR